MDKTKNTNRQIKTKRNSQLIRNALISKVFRDRFPGKRLKPCFSKVLIKIIVARGRRLAAQARDVMRSDDKMTLLQRHMEIVLKLPESKLGMLLPLKKVVVHDESILE